MDVAFPKDKYLLKLIMPLSQSNYKSLPKNINIVCLSDWKVLQLERQ